MRNRITQLSRFLLLCAVMFLVTMIPQSVKAITVEEAGEVYMTDSQAGAGQPLYGRLNINYTGNTNYDPCYLMRFPVLPCIPDRLSR